MENPNPLLFPNSMEMTAKSQIIYFSINPSYDILSFHEIT